MPVGLHYLSIIILCSCFEVTYVDEPEEIKPEQLIERCMRKETKEFPVNYQTCLDFTQLLRKMVQFAIAIAKRKDHDKGQKTDEETPDVELILFYEGSQAKDDEAQKNDLLWRIYYPCVKILSFFCQPILYGVGSESIKRIKQKHILSTKIMEMLIHSERREEYFQSGRNPRTTLPEHMHAYDIDTLRSTYWPSLDSDSDDPSPDYRSSSNRITDKEEDNESKIRRGYDHRPLSKTQKRNLEIPPHKAGYDRPLGNTGKQNLEVSPHKAAKDKPTRETAIHIAAMNGIVEIVKGILSHIPMAIFDANSEAKNIVLLAVEYKQPEVYNLLKSHYKNRMDSLICKVDHEGNSALHLAAKLTDSNPWPVPGAASQMQWEIRWYEYIMQSMPRMFHYLRNNCGETPEEILWKTHNNLIAERREWLSSTSNACSLVAGLLVTVTFPMSTTVPGGVINETGSPYLKDEPAFNAFAISSYISFYSSLIAVVLFLSVLTSAYNKSGFRNDLPTKMLLGLTAFYVSIVSTAISFSAGHYFILREKLKSAAFPAYIGVCLLVIFFAIIEFPLYFQLTWATAKKVPQRQFKVIQGWF
nr:hypothetical protein CFP56_68480 [Quercus suber]